MPELASGPTAEEIEELTDLVRRDPGTPAFVDLGDAYLALGRPRDAIEVGARGLRANPNNTEGRLMISRAFAMLHQWKQAQAELLKVVKIDRNSSDGFRLLGEVLMRRADYDRAVPVLQHAQNLDPANPAVLSLLRKARAGQPLDPPAPIPTPRDPARAGAPGLPRAANGRPDLDEAPTRVADDPLSRFEPAPEPPMRHASPPAAPAAPVAAARQTAGMSSRLPLQSGETDHGPRRGAGPQGAPAVRPRVISAAKPKDAAQADLRQSAAVGENYLNNLLTNGLLDVPSVKVPDSGYDVRAGKRWGRSVVRAFIFLFVLTGVLVGGGGYWYYYTVKEQSKEVAQYQATALARMPSASYADLDAALTAMRDALDIDNRNGQSLAIFSAAGGLRALLYGSSPEGADVAASDAATEVKEGDPGWRELIIGRAALTMVMLEELEAPVERLADARAALEAHLEAQPDDRLVATVLGRALLLAGDRDGARAMFERADNAGEGPVIATIELANMRLDEGDHTAALELYEKALERSKDHPLALLGRALAHSELSDEPAQTAEDLNVGLGKDMGPRIAAYKALAFANSSFVIEAYDDVEEALKEAVGVTEPRFLARLALARLAQGKLKEAAELRTKIAWYGQDDPDPHPLVALVDAEIYLAYGKPDAAIDTLGDAVGVRAHRLRGRALFDLSKYEEAAAELTRALDLAEEDLHAEMWLQGARIVAGKGKARREADDALLRLGRQAKTKVARHIHGVALARIGRIEDGRNRLEQALEDITAEAPHPLAYRTHVELAGLDLAAERVDAAAEHLEAAAEANPAFLPIHKHLGRILLARGDAEGAIESLQRIVDEAELADATTELAYAQALVAQKKVSDEDREAARKAVARAKEKGASGDALAQVAYAVDAEMAEEMGLDEPGDDRKRRRRR